MSARAELLDRARELTNRNLIKFNKDEHRVLHLERKNPLQ